MLFDPIYRLRNLHTSRFTFYFHKINNVNNLLPTPPRVIVLLPPSQN